MVFDVHNIVDPRRALFRKLEQQMVIFLFLPEPMPFNMFQL